MSPKHIEKPKRVFPSRAPPPTRQNESPKRPPPRGGRPPLRTPQGGIYPLLKKNNIVYVRLNHNCLKSRKYHILLVPRFTGKEPINSLAYVRTSEICSQNRAFNFSDFLHEVGNPCGVELWHFSFCPKILVFDFCPFLANFLSFLAKKDPIARFLPNNTLFFPNFIIETIFWVFYWNNVMHILGKFWFG